VFSDGAIVKRSESIKQFAAIQQFHAWIDFIWFKKFAFSETEAGEGVNSFWSLFLMTKGRGNVFATVTLNLNGIPGTRRSDQTSSHEPAGVFSPQSALRG
jgi:hypothetical protein